MRSFVIDEAPLPLCSLSATLGLSIGQNLGLVLQSSQHLVLVAVSFVSMRIIASYPARALRALGLLLADGAPTVGGGKTF